MATSAQDYCQNVSAVQKNHLSTLMPQPVKVRVKTCIFVVNVSKKCTLLPLIDFLWG